MESSSSSSQIRSTHEAFPEADDLIYPNPSCCCCFVFPWTRRQTSASPSSNWWHQIRSPNRSAAAAAWDWASAKLRDWSELAGGPRWKNFIRRFNRGSRQRTARLGSRFQYDPLSYALNFDESPDDAAGFRDFSSRFAAPPSTAKSSMDLGGIRLPAEVAEFSVGPPPSRIADGCTAAA